MTTTSGVGGAERALQQLVERIDRSRFDPLVLSLCPVGTVGEALRDGGAQVLSLDLGETASLLELPGAVWRLSSMLRRLEIDLVHAQLYRANILAPLAAALVRPRTPTVLVQHSLYAMTGRHVERLARLTSPLADRVVAVSPAVRDYVAGEMGVARERIIEIPNGVDAARFAPGAEPMLRAELGTEPDEILLGCVGRLSPEKGVDQLIEALPAICEQAPRIRLVIVGDGPERARLEARAGASPVGDRVHFLGARRDVAPLYRAFDVFVMPSREEAAPLALLEAMASGSAIVATDVGSVREILGDGAGIVVEPNAPGRLTDAIRALLGDAARRRALGRAARGRIEREFEIASTVRAFEAVYGSLLGAGESG